jgi:hypothetical protein
VLIRPSLDPTFLASILLSRCEKLNLEGSVQGPAADRVFLWGSGGVSQATSHAG